LLVIVSALAASAAPIIIAITAGIVTMVRAVTIAAGDSPPR